jgi:hypothetical protein
VRNCEQKWAYAAINKVATLEDARLLLRRRFYGCRTYRTADEVWAAAFESGKVSGLDNFGQTLHILKSTYLKTRDGDTEAFVANTRALLAIVSMKTLIALGHSIATEGGGMRYIALRDNVSQAHFAAVRLLEEDSEAHAAAVRNLTYIATAHRIEHLPDIGALLDDGAFLGTV